jgi:hypothetical protein
MWTRVRHIGSKDARCSPTLINWIFDGMVSGRVRSPVSGRPVATRAAVRMPSTALFVDRDVRRDGENLSTGLQCRGDVALDGIDRVVKLCEPRKLALQHRLIVFLI